MGADVTRLWTWNLLGTIVENVSWVTEDSLWEHEWITATNVTVEENDI